MLSVLRVLGVLQVRKVLGVLRVLEGRRAVGSKGLTGAHCRVRVRLRR